MNGYQPKKCTDKPKPPKTGSKINPPRNSVIYICDRKKCENCSFPTCGHTTDITHAVHFENVGGVFVEKYER